MYYLLRQRERERERERERRERRERRETRETPRDFSIHFTYYYHYYYYKLGQLDTILIGGLEVGRRFATRPADSFHSISKRPEIGLGDGWREDEYRLSLRAGERKQLK